MSLRFRQAAGAVVLLAMLWPIPAAALDLFARHTVTVHFATADEKPMAEADVRVFAPGQPSRPALTGRTDSSGEFEFSANTDGFWSAEAHGTDEIARVVVRVGGGQEESQPMSPLWAVGGLLVLLILALAYRFARARSRARANRGGSPPRTP